jgi:gamma-polyglutamate biosynthesis protein CapA
MSKILTWLIAILIITIILLWPITVLTEKYNNLYLISNQNNLSLSDKIKAAPLKVRNILVFGGDIMLSRTVNTKIEKYQNYNWPFQKISNLFSEANIAIANLESPFLVTDNYQVLSGSFSFKANPKSVSALSLAGLDVLSLANNHILNQGLKGLSDTYNVLKSVGIDYIGTIENNLVIKDSQGIKFAFLSYTYNHDSKLIATITDDSVKSDIAKAKSQADVVILMMHAGTEYTRKPNKDQIDFSHLAIDSGADLVVGTHPHWPQTVENYKGKTIIYSLGNLIFDQMWSKDTSVGLVAKVYFDDKEQANIEYIPITIKDYGQAQIMPDGAEKELLLSAMGLK